jgi:hypothetical protein
VEELCLKSGKTVTESSREEKENFWQEAKKIERKQSENA